MRDISDSWLLLKRCAHLHQHAAQARTKEVDEVGAVGVGDEALKALVQPRTEWHPTEDFAQCPASQIDMSREHGELIYLFKSRQVNGKIANVF